VSQFVCFVSGPFGNSQIPDFWVGPPSVSLSLSRFHKSAKLETKKEPLKRGKSGVWGVALFSGGKPTSSEFLSPSIYLLVFRFVRLFLEVFLAPLPSYSLLGKQLYLKRKREKPVSVLFSFVTNFHFPFGNFAFWLIRIWS